MAETEARKAEPLPLLTSPPGTLVRPLDDDLEEFGASSDSMFSSNATIGITAWWRLQRRHGYAPLVTRVIVDRTYESPAT